MDNSIKKYWKKRLETCRKSLESNNFGAYLANDRKDAKRIVMEDILPGIRVKSVSWGDSLTFYATEILDEMRRNPDINVLETFAENVPREEIIERRRQAFLRS